MKPHSPTVVRKAAAVGRGVPAKPPRPDGYGRAAPLVPYPHRAFCGRILEGAGAKRRIPGHLPLAALAPFGNPVRFFFPTGSPPRALRPLPPLDVPTPGSQVRRGASAPDKASTVLPFSGGRKLNYPSTDFRQLFVLFCGDFDVRKGSEGNSEKLEPRLQVGRQ